MTAYECPKCGNTVRALAGSVAYCWGADVMRRHKTRRMVAA